MILAYDQCHVGAYAMTSIFMVVALSMFMLPPLLFKKYRDQGKFEKALEFKYKKAPVERPSVLVESVKCYSTAIMNTILFRNGPYKKMKNQDDLKINDESGSSTELQCAEKIY